MQFHFLIMLSVKKKAFFALETYFCAQIISLENPFETDYRHVSLDFDEFSPDMHPATETPNVTISPMEKEVSFEDFDSTTPIPLVESQHYLFFGYLCFHLF